MVNVEAEIIAFLTEALDPVPVYADVPKVKPGEFVTVELAGGDSGMFDQSATLIIQSWAQTRYDASELARIVNEVLFDAADADNGIAHVTCNHPYNYPDDMPRYQMVAEVDHV